MKKTLILCLLAICLASAATKDIAIVNCTGSYDKRQELRDRMLQIIRDALPADGYTIISYEAVKKKLADKNGGGDEGAEAALGALAEACSSEGGGGVCHRKVLEDIEADYGARCDVKKGAGGKWVFTFSLEDNKGGVLYEKSYDEKYNPKYNPKTVNDFIDIMSKEIPKALQNTFFGTLDVKPAYRNGIGKNKNWSLYVNNVEKKSYVNNLSPGEYNIRLSHNCYETIESSVKINEGKPEIFDMAKHLNLKTTELLLNAKRNDKLVNEIVYVDGNEKTKTPYEDYNISPCSEITIGRKHEKVNVPWKESERVVYTHEMSLVQKTSTFIAIGLNVLGAAAIGYGVYENIKASNAYDDYGKRGQSAEYYDDAYKKAKSSATKRNVFYIAGGVVLASGIGVHIWF